MTINNSLIDDDDFEDEELNTGSDKIYQNYLMPGLELYDAAVSINHWQLRDCVKHSSTKPSTVYYVYEHSIRSVDMNPRFLGHGSEDFVQNGMKDDGIDLEWVDGRYIKSKYDLIEGEVELNSPSKCVADFNFKPKCFTELDGIVVAGGSFNPDDKGYSLNWSRLTTQMNGDISLSPPASLIKTSDVFSTQDPGNYNNQDMWKGIISIYNPETQVSESLIMGNYINNCVTMHSKSHQDYDLFACNNDSHMYQCKISNRSIELMKRYSDLNFALNHVALSSDAKSMVITGDSNKFAVYKQNELDQFYSLRYDTLPNWGSKNQNLRRVSRYENFDSSASVDHIFEAPNADHGFYSCFSENDLQFATIFQNGVCLLFDVRQMNKPLAEFDSTRSYSHSGAFRVCKFSHGLEDLLFISEHQGRVHVIDTRCLDNHQIIMIPNKVRTNTNIENNEITNSELNTTMDISENLPAISSSGISNSLSTSSSAISSSSNEYPYTNKNSSFKASNMRFTPTTAASQVPIYLLEPQLLPYPKIANHSTNEYTRIQKNGMLLRDDSVNSSKDIDKKSVFVVRRVSTKYDGRYELQSIDLKTLSKSKQSSYKNNIGSSSPKLLSSYQKYLSSFFRNESSSIISENDAMTTNSNLLSNEPAASFSRALENARLHRSGAELANVAVKDPTFELRQEANISGLDWVEDKDGSALIIGTDHGIIKWNINSWARRSFASYDFC